MVEPIAQQALGFSPMLFDFEQLDFVATIALCEMPNIMRVVSKAKSLLNRSESLK
jgi:hypothetical protein